MNIENFKLQISEFGTIQICKADLVFTLLLTGEKLDSWQTIISIQMKVLEFIGHKYPIIEAMKNDSNFYCLVLKSKI